MSVVITTVFHTPRAEAIGDGGTGIISGTVEITAGTAGGDIWKAILSKFKKVRGVCFNAAETTDPVAATLAFDPASGEIEITTAGAMAVTPTFFIAMGAL